MPSSTSLHPNRHVRAALVLVLLAAGCSNDAERRSGAPAGSTSSWKDRNQRVIDRYEVRGRVRGLPDVSLPMTLIAGEPVERSAVPAVTLAPGVMATLGWGRGAVLKRVEMQPAAVYPPQTLREELIFLPDGTSAGTIWAPHYPVSITFGGANSDVLYMVGESSAWAIQTKVRGSRHPEGMN